MKRILGDVALLIMAHALVLPVYAVDHRHNAHGMEFIFIPPGEFRMGTSLDDAETVAWEMESLATSQLAIATGGVGFLEHGTRIHHQAEPTR